MWRYSPVIILLATAMLVSACSIDRDRQVAEQREQVEALVDSIEWPDSYEQGETDTRDPSFGFNDARGGYVRLRFHADAVATNEVLAEFHQVLTEAGMRMRRDVTSRCDMEVATMYYESRDPYTSTSVILNSGLVTVSFGWGIRNLDVERPELGPASDPPKCELTG